MLHLIVWLIALELLGILAFPMTYHLFHRLPDRGYAFSKPIAILLLSYALWVLGYSQLVPNGRQAILFLVVLLAVASAWLCRRSLPEIITFARKNRGILFASEGVFLAFFFFWALLRAMEPAISHTEQPMDYAFLNAVIRSEHFPPNDPWLSGFSISYYYFGYLMTALLTTLASIPSEVSYNLALASIGALAAAGAFSLVFNAIHSQRSNLWNSLLHAALGPIFLLLLGNLEGLLEALRSLGLGSPDFWRWIGIKGLEAPALTRGLPPADVWWWWRGTRVIDTVVEGVSRDYTITEFPFFSLYLGDLHPHVMSLPYALLSLGLSLNILKAKVPLGVSWLRERPWEVVVVALALGSLGFLNSWDFPAYAAFFLLALFFQDFMAHGALSRRVWWDFLPVAAAILVIAVYAYLAFYLELRTQASGILPMLGFGTRPLHYFVFWGFFLVAAVSFILLAFRRLSRLGENKRSLLSALLLPLVPLAVWFAIEVPRSLSKGDLLAGLAVGATKLLFLAPLLLVISALLYLALRAAKSREDADREMVYPFLLLLAGFFLTVMVELFFIRDQFGNRMNTVFKFYYQAWVFLALGCAIAIYYSARLIRGSGGVRRGIELGWRFVIALFFLMGLIYPAFAIATRVDTLRGGLTLNGLAYLQRSSPDEYEGIQWLKENVRGAPVIVEATGGEYSEYGRVSARTGLPTLLGWRGHEVQWRGSDREFQGREQLVDEIYSTKDLEKAQDILRSFKAEYVYVGPLERAKYSQDSLAKFDGFMEKVFQNSQVTIYRLSKR